MVPVEVLTQEFVLGPLYFVYYALVAALGGGGTQEWAIHFIVSGLGTAGWLALLGRLASLR